jgi:hypothetical protein
LALWLRSSPPGRALAPTRGHPDHPEQIKDGALAHDGAGGLRFGEHGLVMPLPNQPKPADVVIELPAAELRVVSVGALRQGARIAQALEAGT